MVRQCAWNGERHWLHLICATKTIELHSFHFPHCRFLTINPNAASPQWTQGGIRALVVVFGGKGFDNKWILSPDETASVPARSPRATSSSLDESVVERAVRTAPAALSAVVGRSLCGRWVSLLDESAGMGLELSLLVSSGGGLRCAGRQGRVWMSLSRRETL